MDYSELNRTELLQALRSRGYPAPAVGWKEEKLAEMLRLIDAGGIPTPGAMTLIDRHRGRIVDWAIENWPKIYNQVSCPLQEAGCGRCSDLRVVSCLVHNNHVFDVTREVLMAAAKWSDIIRLVVEGKTKETIVMLEGLSKLKLIDNRPTRTSLTKVVAAALDLGTQSGCKPFNSYIQMTLDSVEPAVSEFTKDLKLEEIIAKLIPVLKGSVAPATQSEPEDDDEIQAESGEEDEEPQGYFPGVSDDDAPLGPDQDATRFLKNGGGKQGKAAETPKANAGKPSSAAEPPKEPESTSEVSSTTEAPTAHPEPVDDRLVMADALSAIATGLGQMAMGIMRIAEHFAGENGLDRGAVARAVDPTSGTNPPESGDIFFEDDPTDDGFAS